LTASRTILIVWRVKSRGIAALRQHLAKLPVTSTLTFDELRAQYDKAERAFPLPADVEVTDVVMRGVRGESLCPLGANSVIVLYLHGGGYVIGSPRSHRHLAAAIAQAAGGSAILPDYRRAPEHRFPAAVDDAVAAYRWLIDDHGAHPGSVVIAGDSAGGGLMLATLLALRDAGVPSPAAGVGISPWTDLTCSQPSHTTRASVDPIVEASMLRRMVAAYLGTADPRTPLASPLHADLRGLPSLLIQVGSDEVLLDDATSLVARARSAGVDASLEVWDRMVHVWHWFLPMLDEAQDAVDRIATFVRLRTGAGTTPGRLRPGNMGKLATSTDPDARPARPFPPTALRP
jgi:phosphinothricin tripeptide acetyl hydrolase